MNKANPKVEGTGGLKDLVLYFLRLGAVGFGGPIALVGYMERDLVEERGWIAADESGGAWVCDPDRARLLFFKDAIGD